MITHVHRPQTLEQALELLSHPNIVPLGGGTLLSRPSTLRQAQGNASLGAGPRTDSVEVVDLQALGLNRIKKQGNNPSTGSPVPAALAQAGQRLEIGASATLQQLLEDENCSAALRPGLKLEAPLNIRNAATIAGTIVACDGRSAFVTALLALDAKLEQAMLDNSKIEYRASNIGDYLPLRPRGLIIAVTIPLSVKIAFDYVSRTPADKPLVCLALAQWPSGRTRLAVGGYGEAPMLAMDGTESAAASDYVLRSTQAAARNAFHEAADEWASAEFRMDVAATLAKRCLSVAREK